MHCQDVSSFSNAPACVCVLDYLCTLNAPVKMCRLWAGGLVCVCVFIICALNALSRCVFIQQCTCLCVCSRLFVFPKCTCQDVSSLGMGPCVCVCLHYLCPKCIVKMCLHSEMHLSRCVVCGQGPCGVCVLHFYFCPNALSCFVK